MPDYNKLILSVPTSGDGATPAATYAFYTGDYAPPRQGRSTGADHVHNQNGYFKYVYDNGPNSNTWQPFRLVFSNKFNDLGAASVQHGRLMFLWNYIGPIGMQAPEGVYSVVWSDAPQEKAFRSFPNSVGDKIEFEVTVNFEEGGS